MELEMHIEYIIQIWQENNQYIAHAMPIDVMSSGGTPEEARHALYEAVSLFIATAEDLGTLDNILLESGYKRKAGKWISPSWIATERHSTPIMS